jgi:hypothetical protein
MDCTRHNRSGPSQRILSHRRHSVTTRARRGITFTLKAEEDLLEAGEVGGAGAGAGERLALAVIELDEGCDTLPGRAFPEGIRERGNVVGFLLPI